MSEPLLLDADSLPPALRAWLDTFEPGKILVELVRLDDGSLGIRALPGVEPETIERALVTMAKYREALMNLT